MIDFALPSLGADMDQAMLVAWLVEPGDTVEYGQVIAEVETDKGVIEVECWHDGVVEEILRRPGPEKLAVGTPLARIRTNETEAEPTRTEPDDGRDASEVEPAIVAREPSPPVRHLAHTLGVEVAEVEGTGSHGSITREDIRRAAATGVTSPKPAAGSIGARPKASPMARRLATELGVELGSLTSPRPDGLITGGQVTSAVVTKHEDSIVEDPGLSMRRAIARSMSRSKREIPHYYLANRIDLAPALVWLEGENETRSIADRILPAALLLKAAAVAVRDVPELNGFWTDDSFHQSEDVHLGVAISLRDGGLVAPAIHNADSLSLSALMERLRDLVTRARTWRLRGSEMSDPTLTVTNLGDRGVDMAFPVIIPPQVAMVGFGRVVDAVVAHEGQPVVHPVVDATLAADHRVTDGHRGGLFLSALERLLQEPDAL